MGTNEEGLSILTIFLYGLGVVMKTRKMPVQILQEDALLALIYKIKS